MEEQFPKLSFFISLLHSEQFLVITFRFLISSSLWLQPRIDTRHPRWLHLRIRPSTLPFVDPSKSGVYGKAKTKALVDGRWTLAFRDEESCKYALSMIIEEINLQGNEVERRIKPLLDIGSTLHTLNPSSRHPESLSSYLTPSNSL